MKKNVVKINENTLKQIVAESIKKVLNENSILSLFPGKRVVKDFYSRQSGPSYWGSIDGYEWLIYSYLGHPCAYIKIPEGHPALNWLRTHEEQAHSLLDVHGGITYFDAENGVIGWDYAHLGDYCNYGGYDDRKGKKYTVEEIYNEIVEQIESLKGITEDDLS